MANIPSKVYERLSLGIKKFQLILATAKSRDVNESDTVIIVTDMLSEIFGYDKYSEITSEFSIRSTYCDLATKLNGKLQLLIETKAIGLELKDNYIKQAVDYAANQGVDFVVLTNGIIWKAFKVSFTKPINQEMVFEIDFLKLGPRNIDDIEKLFLISKEGWMKSTLYDFLSQKQALSRFFLGAMILSDSVIHVIKRELRKISPDIKITSEQIKNVVYQEVLKREVVEGEKAEEAKKKVNKALSKFSKSKVIKKNVSSEEEKINEQVQNNEQVEG
ncbi:MAG: restriction endonuclease subunit R [candidate division Zixibacteria bacterium CG_4_9_14_3_um_filter_46_8]|nr:MAG: restriction endonuclease subunit R [candidate division Zixibacteria bacterium CG_4_9_14_3_um_filter_46_8]